MKKKIEIYLMTYGQDKRGRNHYIASFYEPEPSEEDMLKLEHVEKKNFLFAGKCRVGRKAS